MICPKCGYGGKRDRKVYVCAVISSEAHKKWVKLGNKSEWLDSMLLELKYDI